MLTRIREFFKQIEVDFKIAWGSIREAFLISWRAGDYAFFTIYMGIALVHILVGFILGATTF